MPQGIELEAYKLRYRATIARENGEVGYTRHTEPSQNTTVRTDATGRFKEMWEQRSVSFTAR